MSHPSEWIGRFLKRYVDTIGPHDFPTDSDDEELEPGQPTAAESFMAGWVYAFRMAHPPVTEVEADAARVRLALYPPAFRRDHLPAVVEVVLKMREKAATEQFHRAMSMPSEEVDAIARSGRCPECSTASGPTGWARRKGMWIDRSWHATTTLYCRCPLGRYRVKLAGPHPAQFDDLQAMPNLWDASLSHPSWSPRPLDPPSVEGRDWRYLAPGEKPPPPIAVKVARDAAMPARSRKPEWAGKIPDGIEMPRPVPRPSPAPGPEPVPADDPTEGHLEWM